VYNYICQRAEAPHSDDKGEKNMGKTYRVELKNLETRKTEIGRTIYGDDLSDILKLFYDIAEKEIGKVRILKSNLHIYEI